MLLHRKIASQIIKRWIGASKKKNRAVLGKTLPCPNVACGFKVALQDLYFTALQRRDYWRLQRNCAACYLICVVVARWLLNYVKINQPLGFWVLHRCDVSCKNAPSRHAASGLVLRKAVRENQVHYVFLWWYFLFWGTRLAYWSWEGKKKHRKLGCVEFRAQCWFGRMVPFCVCLAQPVHPTPTIW